MNAEPKVLSRRYVKNVRDLKNLTQVSVSCADRVSSFPVNEHVEFSDTEIHRLRRLYVSVYTRVHSFDTTCIRNVNNKKLLMIISSITVGISISGFQLCVSAAKYDAFVAHCTIFFF